MGFSCDKPATDNNRDPGGKLLNCFPYGKELVDGFLAHTKPRDHQDNPCQRHLGMPAIAKPVVIDAALQVPCILPLSLSIPALPKEGIDA